ncbi:MAG TPA: hypothetical protein VMT30_07145 [Candidatus Saccharimonadia bacterium]|nr:hypothetical protein [Candidatus Saccharimonadia bacterium]
MIRHLWSILATQSSVDQQTNNLSIFDVMEELTVQLPVDAKLPAVVPLKHTIVSLWQKERGKEVNFELRIEIVGPNGNKLGEIVQKIKTLPQHRRMRTITQMETFPLVGAGEYTFKVFTSESDTVRTLQSELPLDIIIPKIEQ